MRKTLTTVALMLALSCSAFAGIMHTPGAPEPPPDSAQTQSTTTESNTVAADSLTQIALAILAALPSLL
jgi:hypothetical protein